MMEVVSKKTEMIRKIIGSYLKNYVVARCECGCWEESWMAYKL